MNYIKNHIPVLSLILSGIVAWMIVPSIEFPMVAFVIFFVGLSSLLFIFKKDKTWVESIVYFGIVSLSFFQLYRANEFLQFFNFISIVFFIAILARPLSHIQSIFHVILSPITVFFNAFLSENMFKHTFTLPTGMKSKNNIVGYIPTILLTIGIMLITIPLLASANPLFNNVLKQSIDLLQLDWLKRLLIFDSLPIYIFRVIVFVFLAYMIPRGVSVAVKGMKEFPLFPGLPINYLIPKIALSGILIVFFITQLQLYFASPELLQSLGYTNSKLTNEVFAQVTFVAFIVLLLAYGDNTRKKWNTAVTYFLLLEAFFLIAVAFKSVYDYSSLYGFTEKRLWGYASMTWLTGAISAYAYHYYKQTQTASFIKNMLAYSVIVLFTINVLNFDSLIYNTAKPTTYAGVDYDYLARRSVDAHHYAELLPKLVKDIQTSKTFEAKKIQSALHIIRQIDQLRYRYEVRFTINSLNAAEYQEYKATKHINTKEYDKIVSDKQQEMFNNPSPNPTFTP